MDDENNSRGSAAAPTIRGQVVSLEQDEVAMTMEDGEEDTQTRGESISSLANEQHQMETQDGRGAVVSNEPGISNTVVALIEHDNEHALTEQQKFGEGDDEAQSKNESAASRMIDTAAAPSTRTFPNNTTMTACCSTLELDMAMLAQRKALFEHHQRSLIHHHQQQQQAAAAHQQQHYHENESSSFTDQNGEENEFSTSEVGTSDGWCKKSNRDLDASAERNGAVTMMSEKKSDVRYNNMDAEEDGDEKSFSNGSVEMACPVDDSSSVFVVMSMMTGAGFTIDYDEDGNHTDDGNKYDDDKSAAIGDNQDNSSYIYTTEASPDSAFDLYHVIVDPRQEDKAVDIPLYSMKRPHMRAFHLSWASFFVAFGTWFAMTPLLGDIQRSLDLSREEIWTSSVLAVLSSALTRLLMGPLCDRHGARWIMAATLVAGAIPTGLAGWVAHDATSLYLIRFFIGVAGSSFVTCQAWAASMFSREISGTAMALCAGWGNLAGGVFQIIMGSLLFPLFKVIYGGSGYENSHRGSSTDDDEGLINSDTAAGDISSATYSDDDNEYDRPAELSWRTILVFPAIASIIMAWAVVRYGDDTPKGNVDSRRRHNLVDQVSIWKSFQEACSTRNSWVLFVHYSVCFGVEITMTQAAALYFQEEFGQSTESAAAIASVFGWVNLFARGMGGFCSDMANARSGLRGRLWCQFVMLIGEGALVVLFAHTHTLASAIVAMVLFSVFVQAAEGSTFAIVPYVADPKVIGSVAGLVGAGGNVGGVAFALLFRALSYRTAFMYMGFCVIGCALGTVCVAIPGHRGLCIGEDAPSIVEHRRKAKLPEVIVIQRTLVPSTPTPGDHATVVFDAETMTRSDSTVMRR